MRCVAISDTHERADKLVVPDGDVLIHAGDLTMRGEPRELERAAAWLGKLRPRFAAVIAIPGNHDFGAERDPAETRALFESHGVTWLVDEAAAVDGVAFYGSPWQPWFYDWAFNFPRGDDGTVASATWARIPPSTDVLVTHGPPHGILDRTEDGDLAGCPELLAAVEARPRIRAHVFGHIHEGYGCANVGARLFVNASTCDARYAAVNPPIAFDAEPAGVARPSAE
ncbi:MAG TPA: metallophosphatase domain-containing protein [Candidatus Elarobacter sp.]|jgi:Icc-related predicted phosphoesterase|nr:metallophosphatase domain-containing protein [Candidatus Elarobacter sp.]